MIDKIDIRGLRIGNMVTIDNSEGWPELKNKPLMVEGIRKKDPQGTDCFPESKYIINLINVFTQTEYSQFDQFIKPILITEDWIKYCKYDHVEELDAYASKNHLIDGVPGDWVFEPFCTDDQDCWINFKYLHQLQNLHFDQTNEEILF